MDDPVALRHGYLGTACEQLPGARQPDSLSTQRGRGCTPGLLVSSAAERDSPGRRCDRTADDRDLIARQRDRAPGVGPDRAGDIEAVGGGIDAVLISACPRRTAAVPKIAG